MATPNATTKVPQPTPGGPAVAVILCILPLVFLVAVTLVRRIALSTRVSLPAAAVMMAFIRLAYLASPPALVAACVVSGLLEALTPLSIVAGAILLFQAMEHTRCLAWLMGTIKDLSGGCPLAEVMLIGFSFSYLVEGASGFGTPTALAAPMLAALGHDPVLSVCALLVINGVSAQFGAVGTPIWFGFAGVGLGEAALRSVGFKAAVVVGVCAYFIVPIAASLVVPWRDVLRGAPFVLLSITGAVAPSVAVALFSYEFPTLLGGLLSLLFTALLVRYKVGLGPLLKGAAHNQKQQQQQQQQDAAAAADKAEAGLAAAAGANTAAAQVAAAAAGPSAVSLTQLLDVNRSAASVDGRNKLLRSRSGRSDRTSEDGRGRLSTDGGNDGDDDDDDGSDSDDNALPYIPPGLGSIPAFQIPYDVRVNRRDAATQADDAAWARLGLREQQQQQEQQRRQSDPASPASTAAPAAVAAEAPAGSGGGQPQGLAPPQQPLGVPVKRPSALRASGAAPRAKGLHVYIPTEKSGSSGGGGLGEVMAARSGSGFSSLAGPTTPASAKDAGLGGDAGDKAAAPAPQSAAAWLRTAALRTLPLTGTVLLLLLTRVPQLRIKGALQSPTPRFLLKLGTLGDFGISASLVVQLLDVLRAGVSWKYELLYVPALLPFVAMSALTLAVFRRDLRGTPWQRPFHEAFNRVGGVAVATFGALVLVQLMRHGGTDSPAYLIGFYVSGGLKQGFLAIGALLGAIGSFFSGSTTVSNLTFAEIQVIAADRLHMPASAFLAVQTAGAAAGNAFCIANILAAKAVMGLQDTPEGLFVARTLPAGLLMCVLAQAVGLLFTLGRLLPAPTDVP